jgi:predicted nucleotidyltransferase
MDSQAIEALLREFLASVAEREEIAAAYLFGSVARGTAGPGSDVGLGVLYSEAMLWNESELAREIKELLGFPIQLVVLNEAWPELIIRIFRESRLLLEKNRSQRVQFEVQSRNEYWDFEPNLLLYREKNHVPAPSLEDLVQRYRQSR